MGNLSDTNWLSKDVEMLNREVAQAQLRTVYIADWRSQRIQQLGNLPQPLQSIGYGILGYDADGRRLDRVKLYEVQNRSLQQFDELVSGDRLQILSVIFPKFASIAEAAWQLIAQLPYLCDIKLFRIKCPNVQVRCQCHNLSSNTFSLAIAPSSLQCLQLPIL